MANNTNNKLQYYEFELDSLDANGSAAAGVASTDWPVFLLGGKTPLTNIARMKILEVQIPFTWYVFNSANTAYNGDPGGTPNPGSQWTLVETGGVSSGLSLYPVIVTGNYSGGAALATALQNALNAVSSLYVVTFDATTQKLLFTTTKASVTSFTFTFGLPTNSGNKNPRLYIGFPGGTTSSSGTSMVSPNVVMISGPNYLYVNSLAIGQLTNLYLPQGAVNLGGGNAGPQMAKVPVSVTSGNVIFWQDPATQWSEWFQVQNLPLLNKVDFYLTLGNTTTQIPLQLNGLSFSLKLGVHVNTLTNEDLTSGIEYNERVVKRIRPA